MQDCFQVSHRDLLSEALPWADLYPSAGRSAQAIFVPSFLTRSSRSKNRRGIINVPNFSDRFTVLGHARKLLNLLVLIALCARATETPPLSSQDPLSTVAKSKIPPACRALWALTLKGLKKTPLRERIEEMEIAKKLPRINRFAVLPEKAGEALLTLRKKPLEDFFPHDFRDVPSTVIGTKDDPFPAQKRLLERYIAHSLDLEEYGGIHDGFTDKFQKWFKKHGSAQLDRGLLTQMLNESSLVTPISGDATEVKKTFGDLLDHVKTAYQKHYFPQLQKLPDEIVRIDTIVASQEAPGEVLRKLRQLPLETFFQKDFSKATSTEISQGLDPFAPQVKQLQHYVNEAWRLDDLTEVHEGRSQTFKDWYQVNGEAQFDRGLLQQMLSETIKVRPKNGPPIEKKRTFGDFLDRIDANFMARKLPWQDKAAIQIVHDPRVRDAMKPLGTAAKVTAKWTGNTLNNAIGFGVAASIVVSFSAPVAEPLASKAKQWGTYFFHDFSQTEQAELKKYNPPPRADSEAAKLHILEEQIAQTVDPAAKADLEKKRDALAKTLEDKAKDSIYALEAKLKAFTQKSQKQLETANYSEKVKQDIAAEYARQFYGPYQQYLLDIQSFNDSVTRDARGWFADYWLRQPVSFANALSAQESLLQELKSQWDELQDHPEIKARVERRVAQLLEVEKKRHLTPAEQTELVRGGERLSLPQRITFENRKKAALLLAWKMQDAQYDRAARITEKNTPMHRIRDSFALNDYYQEMWDEIQFVKEKMGYIPEFERRQASAMERAREEASLAVERNADTRIPAGTTSSSRAKRPGSSKF